MSPQRMRGEACYQTGVGPVSRWAFAFLHPRGLLGFSVVVLISGNPLEGENDQQLCVAAITILGLSKPIEHSIDPPNVGCSDYIVGFSKQVNVFEGWVELKRI